VPMYEYRCPACERVFEELIRNRQDELEVACPECGTPDVHRVLSGFAVGSGGGSGGARMSSGCSSSSPFS